MALAAPAASLAFLAQPLPGRDLSPEPWDVLRIHAAVMESTSSCDGLERRVPPAGSAARAMPELAKAVGRCVAAILVEADTVASGLAPSNAARRPPLRDRLASLLATGLVADQQRAQLEARLAALDAEARPAAQRAEDDGGLGSGSGIAMELGSGGRRPIVELEPSARPVVLGGLRENAVRRVVQQHLPELRNCLERALAGTSNRHGRMDVRFVIGPAGTVVSAAVTSELDGGLRSCVGDAVRKMAFPKPDRGELVVVTYPFEFDAG